jgi:hypothetical protein
MASLYISEFYKGVSVQGTALSQSLPAPSLVDQTPLSISGSSATSAQFSASTNEVLLISDTDCWIKFGGSSVAATSSDLYLPAKTYIRFGVAPSTYVAAIT